MPCGPTMRRNQKNLVAPATATCRRGRGPSFSPGLLCYCSLLRFMIGLHAVVCCADNEFPGPQCLERARASGNVQL